MSVAASFKTTPELTSSGVALSGEQRRRATCVVCAAVARGYLTTDAAAEVLLVLGLVTSSDVRRKGEVSS